MSPPQYLRILRFQEAVRLLREQHLRMTQHETTNAVLAFWKRVFDTYH